MKIIVDANIVFSGILNANSKIGNLLINSQKHFDFIAPDFLRDEIRGNYFRLSKISSMTHLQVREAEFQICKKITFISEAQITNSEWLYANNLVADIDPKDAHYVAYSKHFRCKVWSGDKALMNGLAKKRFHNFIATDELYKLWQNIK